MPHFITKTYLYNFDPLKPQFYIVKLGFTGVFITFLISAQNIDCGYSLEQPRRGGSNEYPQSMFWAEIWKITEFFIWKFSVFQGEIYPILLIYQFIKHVWTIKRQFLRNMEPWSSCKLSKQCRPWSDTALCGGWSGSALFANVLVQILQTTLLTLHLTSQWQE